MVSPRHPRPDRGLPSGSPIDTLKPEYDTERNTTESRGRKQHGGQSKRQEARSGMVRKIALEEHFLCPGFEDYWKTTVGDVDPAIYRHVLTALRDFGELRLGAMDEA